MDVNLPKFLAHDIPLFEGIISDLFPGIELPKADYTEFLAAVASVCEQRNLQPVKFFNEKVIQMYEMMIVRHGWVLWWSERFFHIQPVQVSCSFTKNQCRIVSQLFFY